LIGSHFSQTHYIGWSTTKHTAEDVFLAIYAPEFVQKLHGVVDNYEIGEYIGKVLALEDFDTATKELFE
jgi:alkaline phosphatase